jgi:Phage portal protein
MAWWNTVGRTVAGWFRPRFSSPGLDPSGASVITTTYGLNGNESIIPMISTAAREAYTGNAVVFGAILARLSLFSEATFAFQDIGDKSLHGQYEQDGRKNTELNKLEFPWPNGTTGELLARMIQDVDLTGNAFIWDAGEQLVRLRPDWVTIVSEIHVDPLGREYRVVVGFFYDPPPNSYADNGQPALFSVDEVAHWAPTPDPWAMWRGMSWLTPVFRDIWADNGMTDYKIKYLTNAASPNLLIRYTQKIGQATVTRIRERIEDRHGGVDNAFKTLVLDEGADVTVIGNTFEQMNFSTVQAAGENRIIIASGVPGIVIGSKEGLMAATYSNYEQAMRRFADVTMRPLWRSACACLSTLITVPDGSKLWYDVSDIAALRQGEKERADTTFVLAQAAAILVREGYDAKSVTAAVTSGDLTQLTWTKPVPPPTKYDPDLLLADPALTPAPPPGLAPPGQKPPAPPTANGATRPALNGAAK